MGDVLAGRVASVIPRPQRQELISRAHLFAVAARAGFNIWRPEHDFGVDFHLSAVHVDPETGRHLDAGLSFGLQLKCTVRWRHVGGEVVYDLEGKTWNDMVGRDPSRLLFLGLLCLPRDEAEWLSCEEERTMIQHCAYWYRPDGGDKVDPGSTHRIKIPRDNLLTPASLDAMMAQAEIARAPRRRRRP